MIRRKAACWAASLGLVSSLAVLAPSSISVQAAQPAPGHTGLVPDVPRKDMPRITSGEITDLEYIGNRVFIAGTFSSIRNNRSGNTTSYSQPYLASYNVDTGLVDTTFRPTFGGGGVTEIEASPDGTRLYVVGRFNTVNGVKKRKVAALNPTNGSVITGFTANANSAASAVEATATTVYIGGQFSAVNGATRVGLAAVNATTGAVVTGFDNNLSGGIGVNGAITVQALVLSHDDSKLVVVHTARQIAGQDRYGVGIIDTGTNQLSPWTTNLWRDNLPFVGGIMRADAAAISPDDSYFVVTSGSGGDRPPINDTAVAFDLDGGAAMQPRWVSRMFDSVYSVAISETAVYVGGHFNFQESPTAPDPWPGLDDRGYGNGQGLGAYVLGDDIVTRDHIGALDPATGKALEWNPGSNSFEGNKAMLVTPRGLVTGGDAGIQGGLSVGRVAFYDLSSVPAAGANDTTITGPIQGRVLPAGEPFTVFGTARATSGVRRVQLEIKDRDTGQYLQDDLVTWGRSNTILTTLAAVNAPSTTWSLSLSIPGNHRFMAYAKAFAVNGTNDPTKATKRFETFGVSDATPSTSIAGPLGTVIPSTTFTLSGTATDDVGVNALTYTFRDSQNRYLQSDGTTDAGFNSFRGQPDVVGATNATWSYEVTLPYEDEWAVQATAIDTAGQPDLRAAVRRWIVSSTAVAPSVAVTTPAVNNPPVTTAPVTVTPGSPITFSGTANDDEGLNDIEILLRNTSTQEVLTAGGAWGAGLSPGWYRISGAGSLSGASANWSYTTPFNLSAGSYSFAVRATDDIGLTTATTNQGRLTVNAQVPGDAFPDGTLTLTGTQTGVQVLHLDLSGNAADDNGVVAVRVALRDLDTSRYVQPDGTLDAAYALLDGVVANPGATATSWTIGVDLPSQGEYSVTAFAYDTANQQDPDTTGATARYLVYPGDLPPTNTEGLLSPPEGAVFTDAKIFVSGRFEDDQQMAQVQVAIVDSAGRYMSSTGTFPSTTESWRPAFLTSPGSPGSNFSFTSPAVPAGAYTVRVRGVDQHGFITTTPSERHVTVAAPASNPPVANFTMSCTQNVCSFDARSSTDENATTLTYSWNFGTGQGTATGPVPSRTYTAPGTFTITLTARDEYGLTGTTSQTVTITEPQGNSAPTAVLNPPSCAGLVCNLSAVGSSDPNTGDALSYSWDFGDGTPASTSASLSHTYAAAGTYTITLTVRDGWGKSATASVQVTVA